MHAALRRPSAVRGSERDNSVEAQPLHLPKEDFFKEHFPPDLAIPPLCLIVGGPGSRSTLHADHLSWTGWNLLLTGCKLWRFFRRPEAAACRPISLLGQSASLVKAAFVFGLSAIRDTWKTLSGVHVALVSCWT